MKKIFVLFFLVCAFTFAQSKISWNEVAPGIWKTIVGKPDKIDFLKVASNKPKVDALTKMNSVKFPLSKEEIKTTVVDNKTYIRFPLERGEKIFGLGLNFQTVEQRGRIMRLHVDHYGGQDNGRNHAPVPFYVSSNGYGVFINSARYIDVWVGCAVRKDSKNPPPIRDRNTEPNWDPNPYSDNVEILVPTNGAEVFVFGGPEPLDAVKRFNLFNGGGTLPPKWGLGFWQRTPTLYDEKKILNEVKEFAEHKFPLTVIGLEPGWQSKAYPNTYQWDKGRFPNPKNLIDELKSKGVYVNNWMNPYISPDCDVYKDILPYTATHTVWNGIIPDYSMSQVKKIMEAHFKKYLLNHGVSGLKMDETDGYDEWLWPDVAIFPSRNSAEQMRQLYGVMMQKFITDLYKKENLRTYGLTRASNAGASSFPFVIYNDYYKHQDFITALINSSFIGVLWTPEVRSSKTSEEWLRRIQTVCFSPIAMINAWYDGTKPWTFPEVESQVQEYANLRMQMIPYLYTTYADYAFYGTPPIKAMNLEPGFSFSSSTQKGELSSTENPYAVAVKSEIKDQFMVGDYLLVAPLFAGEKTRKVILPKGKWFDFYTGKFVGDGEIISVEDGYKKLPVYVKDGGIIPMMPVTATIPKEKVLLEVRVYGSKENSYELYDDDGVSYDYEKGKFSRIKLKTEKDSNGKHVGKVEITDKEKVWSYSNFTWRFMSE